MSITNINYHLPVGDRAQMRRSLIETFVNETPGTGGGEDASRYMYTVERFGDYTIYLKRPTQLNKGFDFTVNIEGVFFKKQRRYSNPRHQDIADALFECKQKNPNDFDKISSSIRDIYACREVDFSSPSNLFFTDYQNELHPIEIILLAIKWLFMEQDCAYWNYSGRRMFFEYLQSKDFV